MAASNRDAPSHPDRTRLQDFSCPPLAAMKYIASRLKRLSVEGEETPAFYRAQARRMLDRHSTADPNFRHFLLETVRGCAEMMDPETRREACEILRPRPRPVFIRNKIKIAKKDHRLSGHLYDQSE